jgi:hypothetical protein
VDFEVIFWTAFFFGGDILVLVLLIIWAMRKDREKAQANTRNHNVYTE